MIRLFKASSNYAAFLNYVHKAVPDIKERSYHEYLEQIFKYCFTESNFFKINLEQTGEYCVEEVISNEEILQKKWAFENNISYSDNNWYLDILEAQLLKFQPHVFFAHDHKTLNTTFLEKIRRSIPELKLVLGWDGINLGDTVLFSGVDIVLTPAEFITSRYINQNKKAYSLSFGFEESILDRLKTEPEKDDICFIGSIFLRQNGHSLRKELLVNLMKRTDISLYLSGETDAFKGPSLKRMLSLFKRNSLRDVIDLYKLSTASKGNLYGIDMYQKFYNSKIVINKHIDAAADFAANIRLFEATGSGACLLTDYKKNLDDFFEIDKEIVVYRDNEDCLKKISYLLENEDKRKAIALAGQQRTLTHYTYKQRMEKLDNIIKKSLASI
jgi:spore maturation protein CgeB